MNTLFTIVLVVLGCSEKSTQDSLPHPDFSLTAVSPAIAVGNFEGRTKALEEKHAAGSLSFYEAKSLVAHWKIKLSLFGNVQLIKNIDQLTADFYSEQPEQLDVIKLRANALAFMHRFDEALALTGGADFPDLTNSIDQAREQNLDVITALRRQEFAQFPSVSNGVLLADILAKQNLPQEADGVLHKTLDHYRDVSPFVLAELFFRLGMLWGEIANPPDLGLARHNYEAAISYLPQYAQARVHLAEVYHEFGQDDQAVEILVPTLSVGDPEGRGAFSELVDTEEAREYLESAKNDYRDLLAGYRLAFADHGSEFFMGPGNDPGFAVELATENLENRATKSSYQLAIDAFVNKDEHSRACELKKALPARFIGVVGAELICE